MSKLITHLHVFARNACASRGALKVGNSVFFCLIGRTGRRYGKREGDGASPKGKWKLTQLYYRPDRMGRPYFPSNAKALKPTDGWCDAAGHGQYNRFVTLPFNASHENLWRNDQAYDLIFTTDHNLRPRRQFGGSAIFLHVINAGASRTEGCIALSKKDLLQVLRRCSRQTYLVI